MALLNELNNEIPKWGQKGYSLNELNKN
jgi:hypothetical protein